MSTKIQINQKSLIFGAVAFLLSIAAFALFQYVGLAIVPMVILSACAGCFVMSVLCATTKLLYIFIPASVLCALFITFNAYYTILSLLPFVLALIIADAVSKKGSKLEVIAMCDVVAIVIIIIGIFAQLIFFSKDRVGISILVDSFNAFFDAFRVQLEDALKQSGIYQVLSEMYSQSFGSEDAFIESIVSEVIFVSKAITPSIFIFLVSIFSYLSIAFFSLVARVTGMRFVIPNEKWIMIPSSISCIVFISSVLAYFIASIIGDTSVMVVIAMVALNLIIILLSPMLACGVRGVIGKMKNPMMRPRAIFVLVVGVLALILNFIYGLLFFALEGAWDMLGYYRKLKMWKDNNANE